MKLSKVLPWILLIGSLVGLLAAFQLTYDKLHVLADKDYHPACNINPILSCESVMMTPQANLFGMPNTIFGIAGFSVLAALAVLLLMGVELPKKVWLGLQLGVMAGLAFALYLFFQGVYRINAICPYCFLIWISMPPVFWYTTLYNTQQGYLPIKPAIAKFIRRHHADLLLVWYLVFFGLLLEHFWYYWSTLL
jgi:uncharacterized membrane protein